jgi:hypothetical protein
MKAGTSFVCGKCRNVLEVPDAGPVIQPIRQPPGATKGTKGSAAPPPTVSMTPEQVRKALKASKDVAAARPAAAAGGAQERKLPKAMQKRAQASASQSAQRAGGQTGQLPDPGPAAKQKKAKGGQRRAAAKPARGGGGSGGRAAPAGKAKKKNNGPVMAGVGGLIVLIGIVAFVMSQGGGDEETGPVGGTDPAAINGAETATGGTGGNGNPAGANSTGGNATAGNAAGANAANAGGGNTPAVFDPNNPVDSFTAMTTQAQNDHFAKEMQGATGSVDKLKSLYDFYSDEKLAGNAVAKKARKMIGESALRIESGSDWANEAVGRKNLKAFLETCRSECPTAFSYADNDEIALREKLADLEKEEKTWVESSEFDEFEKIATRIRAREIELKDDDRLVEVEKQKKWVVDNDLFKGFEIIARNEDPYVIFQQYPLHDADMARYNEMRVRKARHFAKRDGIVFNELNNQFRQLFGDRFGLPTLSEKGRLLRVIIMWDRESFDAWHTKQNSGIPGLVRAYYSPTERQIVHYVGKEALTEQDFIKCAKGRIQKESDQVTFHEGTHQLMHEYGNIYRGTPLPNDPDTEAATPPRKSMWFSEGLAEFMGAVEIDEADAKDLGGKFYGQRLLLGRLRFARSLRSQQMPKWSLSKMLLPNHNGELMQMGNEVIPNRGDLAANLFYAQAWAFVHFSWFYDNGKYRDKFLNYMELVLKDEHSPEALARTYGLPSAEDFGEVDKEFDWYWTQLLRRKIGKKKSGAGWWLTDTDPPEGSMEEEGDGGDYDE